MTETEEDIEKTSAEAPPKEIRKLTDAQWAELVELWELGEARLEDLRDKFGISITAISKGLKKRSAVKGRRASEKARAVSEALKGYAVDEAISGAELRSKRVDASREDNYKWIEALQKMTMAKVIEAQKTGAGFANIQNDLKALKSAMEIIGIGRQERWKILNMENEVDETELPELIIRDLSQEEVEQLRNQDDDELGLARPEVDVDALLDDEVEK